GSEKLVLREVFTSVQDSGSLSEYIRTYVFVRFSSLCSHREMYSSEPNSIENLSWKRDFLIRWRIMWLSKLGLRQHSGKKVIVWLKDMYQSRRTSLIFYSRYGDLPYLLDIKMDKHLFCALVQFWNPAYSCFTFRGVDLVPTVEEYMALLRCSKIQVDKAYSRAKGDSKCIPLKNLKDLILAHPNTKKKVDVFALSVYGLVIFPKALGHVDEAFTDLFDRLDKRVTPVPTILAETSRSLNECWRAGEGRFIRCVKLLLAWFYSHFWKVDRDIKWRAPWMLPDEILYRCGDFDWVPLLGIWGAIGYASLLILRQYRSRQIVPVTQGLVQCEFSYKGDGYKKKIREMSNTWNQTRRIKRLAVGLVTTHEYIEWWGRRINDNIPGPSQGDSQPTRKH
ncbi:hypothetical protein Gotur_003649, partial [Gossypium turneri]